MIGRKLSHYQITARLGAGGMGEVYRARDERLGRDVALKILPPDVAGDRGRLARFRREARVLAGLDHPNLITVFSIEEDADPPFLTMELVEGGTLGDIIPRRGFGIERFFAVAIPMVDAVAAAHAAGVVHRDLKPANVMVGRNDRVKVLDFGLAKPEAETFGANSEGTTVHLTAEGRVVGTVAYMSPEQLRGEPADARSDIFALGILLYELATGRSPFQGSSSVDLMSSILRERPPSVTDIKNDLPPHLAGILRRCLNKDPEERFQSARDLKFALEELERELARGEAVPSAREVGKPARRGGLGVWLALAGVIAAAGLGLWLGRMGRTRPVDESVESQLAMPIVTWPSDEGDARLSPDGQWLAFVSDRDGSPGLFVQRADGGEAHRLLAGGRPVVSLAWSPEGDEVAALTGDERDRRLEIVPAPLGGTPRLSLEVSRSNRLVDWVGDEIFLESYKDLLRFDLATGQTSAVPIPGEDFEYRRQFDLDPAARLAVFSAVRQGRENLWMFDLASERLWPLTDDAAKENYPQCLGETCERVLYRSNRTGQFDVWILDRDRGTSRQLRVPAAVQGVTSASVDGALVAFRVVTENANLRIWDRATGRDVPMTADTLPDYAASAARTGPVVALQRALPSTEIQSRFLDSRILVAERAGGTLTGLRPLGDGGYGPLASPGGRWVAFFRTAVASESPYRTELWVADVESGRTRRVSEHVQATGYWLSPTGLLGRAVAWRGANELVFVDADESMTPRIQRLDLAGEETSQTLAVLAARSQVPDLYATATGDVFFSSVDLEGGGWRLNLLAPGSEPPVRALEPPVADAGTLRLLGYREAKRAYVVLSTSMDLNLPGPVEVLGLTTVGAAQRYASLERAIASTASLSPDGERLYLAVAEDGVINLFEVDLADGEARPLTRNDLPGSTIAGIEPLAEAVIYSRQQSNADLWLLRRGAAGQSNGR